MAFTRTWDETFPPDTQNANQLGLDIRQVKQDVRERMKAFGAGPLANREVAPDSVFGDTNVGITYFATDNNILYRWNGNAWVTAHDFGSSSSIFTVGGAVFSQSAAINIVTWRAPFACTVTNVRGYRIGGTAASVNARKNGTLNHLAADLSLVTADVWTDGGAVQNVAYAVGDKFEVMFTVLTGAPAQVSIQVDFTRP